MLLATHTLDHFCIRPNRFLTQNSKSETSWLGDSLDGALGVLQDGGSKELGDPYQADAVDLHNLVVHLDPGQVSDVRSSSSSSSQTHGQ